MKTIPTRRAGGVSPLINRGQRESLDDRRRLLCLPFHPVSGKALATGPFQAIFVLLLLVTVNVQAQDPPAPPPAPKVDLSQSQLQLLRDFERFEKSLYDVAEFSRRTDPDQAELLYRARSQSQEQRILDEMRLLADTLKPQAGGKVVIGDTPEKQAEVIARLQTLLKVLQSADERDRLQREIERIQDLLKGTNALIGKQRDVRSDTSRGGDQKQLSEREKKLIEEAQKLAQKIDKQDAERRGESPDGKKPGADEKEQKPGAEQKPGDQKPGDEKPGEKPEGDQKPGEKGSESSKGSEKSSPMGESKDPMKPQDGKEPMPGDKGSEQKPMDQKPGDEKPGEQKPGEQKPGAQPMDGQPQEGSQQKSSSKPQDQQQKGQQGQPPKGQQPQELGEQKPGEQPQQQAGDEQPQESKKTPGRDELEEARRQMQRALEELDKLNREGSTEAQKDALAQLEKVKARLEAILRQLREEENELLLASLEARFQKLRKAQMQVNVETVRLAKTVGEDRSRHDDRAIALGRDEREIVVDAEKALSLLKEEGSSVAFPEAIEQMRENMVDVANRLNGGDTASTTQVIEELIVETLDEMILAMQQEMEKAKDKDKQKQQQKQQQQNDDEQALINELAELKMIRSLQNQINRLTREIGRELDGEQSSDPKVRDLTDRLSRRQKRLQDATYDLSTGKNK